MAFRLFQFNATNGLKAIGSSLSVSAACYFSQVNDSSNNNVQCDDSSLNPSNDEVTLPQDSESKPPVFAALFLDEKSRTLLKEKYPAKFQKSFYDHMTVAYNPSDEELDDLKDHCAQPFKISVIGVAQDKNCQTLLAIPTDLPIPVQNTSPHITLSVDEENGIGPKYSNILFDRLIEAGYANDSDRWEGHLDSYVDETSGESYSDTPATFQAVESTLELTGTFCINNDWDSEKLECKCVPECSFCKFMKKGPCGKEFRAWEVCVEGSKNNDEDFVDRCAPLTFALKECVDANPEYYSVLFSDDEENSESEAPQESASEEPSESSGASTNRADDKIVQEQKEPAQEQNEPVQEQTTVDAEPSVAEKEENAVESAKEESPVTKNDA